VIAFNSIDRAQKKKKCFLLNLLLSQFVAQNIQTLTPPPPETCAKPGFSTFPAAILKSQTSCLVVKSLKSNGKRLYVKLDDTFANHNIPHYIYLTGTKRTGSSARTVS
jgi:hypothetical protein